MQLLRYCSRLRSIATHGATRGLHGVEEPRAAPKLTAALSEGEKLVVYPTSFLNLRWLLNDEFANTAMQMRNLMVTDHPLVGTLRTLISNTGTSIWSLIILLLSKANESAASVTPHPKSIGGILPQQRVLAEIVQMIRVSHLLHASILNTTANSDLNVYNTGNKLTLLGGDHLLSQAFKALAELRNSDVNELICAASRNLFESEFIGLRDDQNQPLPSKPIQMADDAACHLVDNADMNPLQVKGMLGSGRSEWTLRNLLGGASLLGKSCEGALTLAQKPPAEQKQAYHFGKAFALAEKARHDADIFFGDECEGAFSLVSAPVLFHLGAQPELYAEIKRGEKSVRDVDYKKIWLAVKGGNGVELTKELQREHLDRAYNILETMFEHSDARQSLVDILRAIEVR